MNRIIFLLQLIIAVGLLFRGRKLYWVFVGSVGFISVTELVLANITIQQEWLVVLIGLAAGVLGAALTIYLRMAGFGLAGFLGGVYVFSVISSWASIQNPPQIWGMLLLGGIGGLLLVFTVLDWALIIISSLTGAVMVASLVTMKDTNAWLLTAVLLAVGVLVQSRLIIQAKTDIPGSSSR